MFGCRGSSEARAYSSLFNYVLFRQWFSCVSLKFGMLSPGGGCGVSFTIVSFALFFFIFVFDGGGGVRSLFLSLSLLLYFLCLLLLSATALPDIYELASWWMLQREYESAFVHVNRILPNCVV